MLLATSMPVTGCAQQTFTISKQTVTPKETITHHFFVSGIGQKKTVDAAKICGGAENVIEKRNPANDYVMDCSVLLLSIYTPLEAHVYCSQ